jgi:hypothetical protein
MTSIKNGAAAYRFGIRHLDGKVKQVTDESILTVQESWLIDYIQSKVLKDDNQNQSTGWH